MAAPTALNRTEGAKILPIARHDQRLSTPPIASVTPATCCIVTVPLSAVNGPTFGSFGQTVYGSAMATVFMTFAVFLDTVWRADVRRSASDAERARDDEERESERKYSRGGPAPFQYVEPAPGGPGAPVPLEGGCVAAAADSNAVKMLEILRSEEGRPLGYRVFVFFDPALAANYMRMFGAMVEGLIAYNAKYVDAVDVAAAIARENARRAGIQISSDFINTVGRCPTAVLTDRTHWKAAVAVYGTGTALAGAAADGAVDNVRLDDRCLMSPEVVFSAEIAIRPFEGLCAAQSSPSNYFKPDGSFVFPWRAMLVGEMFRGRRIALLMFPWLVRRDAYREREAAISLARDARMIACGDGMTDAAVELMDDSDSDESGADAAEDAEGVEAAARRERAADREAARNARAREANKAGAALMSRVFAGRGAASGGGGHAEVGTGTDFGGGNSDDEDASLFGGGGLALGADLGADLNARAAAVLGTRPANLSLLGGDPAPGAPSMDALPAAAAAAAPRAPQLTVSVRDSRLQVMPANMHSLLGPGPRDAPSIVPRTLSEIGAYYALRRPGAGPARVRELAREHIFAVNVALSDAQYMSPSALAVGAYMAGIASGSRRPNATLPRFHLFPRVEPLVQGSAFMNMIARKLGKYSSAERCYNAHFPLLLCELAAHSSFWHSWSLHPNILMVGPGDTSKSWIIVVVMGWQLREMVKEEGKGTVNADTTATNVCYTTTFQSEANLTYLGVAPSTGGAGATGKGPAGAGGTTDREALTKDKLTCMYMPVSYCVHGRVGGVTQRVTEHVIYYCIGSSITAMNSGAEFLSTSMRTRFIMVSVIDNDRLDGMTRGDIRVPDPVEHDEFAEEQRNLFSLVGLVYLQLQGGALGGAVDTGIPDVLFPLFEAELKRAGCVVQGNRKKENIMTLCRTLTIMLAIFKVFQYGPAGIYAGCAWRPEQLDALTPLLVVDYEVTAFVFSMIAFHVWVRHDTHRIVCAIRDAFFGGGGADALGRAYAYNLENGVFDPRYVAVEDQTMSETAMVMAIINHIESTSHVTLAESQVKTVLHDLRRGAAFESSTAGFPPLVVPEFAGTSLRELSTLTLGMLPSPDHERLLGARRAFHGLARPVSGVGMVPLLSTRVAETQAVEAACAGSKRPAPTVAESAAKKRRDAEAATEMELKRVRAAVASVAAARAARRSAAWGGPILERFDEDTEAAESETRRVSGTGLGMTETVPSVAEMASVFGARNEDAAPEAAVRAVAPREDTISNSSPLSEASLQEPSAPVAPPLRSVMGLSVRRTPRGFQWLFATELFRKLRDPRDTIRAVVRAMFSFRSVCAMDLLMGFSVHDNVPNVADRVKIPSASASALPARGLNLDMRYNMALRAERLVKQTMRDVLSMVQARTPSGSGVVDEYTRVQARLNTQLESLHTGYDELFRRVGDTGDPDAVVTYDDAEGLQGAIFLRRFEEYGSMVYYRHNGPGDGEHADAFLSLKGYSADELCALHPLGELLPDAFEALCRRRIGHAYTALPLYPDAFLPIEYHRNSHRHDFSRALALDSSKKTVISSAATRLLKSSEVISSAHAAMAASVEAEARAARYAEINREARTVAKRARQRAGGGGGSLTPRSAEPDVPTLERLGGASSQSAPAPPVVHRNTFLSRRPHSGNSLAAGVERAGVLAAAADAMSGGDSAAKASVSGGAFGSIRGRLRVGPL